MDKIYRRKTQEGGRPRKKDDEKARKRNVIVNFRVSPTEKKLLDARIALCGLPKAEFFIESCLYQNILVKGNIKTFDAINARMKEISNALEREVHLEEFDAELVESWKTILEILERLYVRRNGYGKEIL